MPWKVFPENGRYCVHKLNADDSKGEEVGCHDSEGEAMAQIKALYANTNVKESIMNSRIFGNSYEPISHKGRNYWVVPGVPVRAQVMNDYLVPPAEIGDFVQAWNGTPITIHHPKMNNGSVNVPDPDVAIIGRFYGSKFDGQRMTGEYWIDLDEAKKYEEGNTILQNIEAGKILETSTGYFAQEDHTPGMYNGQSYQFIHRNLRPDHIAILPDKVGACSVRDGCGVNLNESTVPAYKADHLPAAMLYGYSFNKGSRTAEQLEGLRNHIKEKGIDKPVSLMRTEEGEIRILDGNHRVAMAQELGIEQIPVECVNQDLQPINAEILYKEWLHKNDQMYLHCASCDCPYKNKNTMTPATRSAGALEQNETIGKESQMVTIQDLLNRLKGNGWTVKTNDAGELEEIKEPAAQVPPEPKKEDEPKQNEGEWTPEDMAAVKELIALLPTLKQLMGVTQDVGEAIQMAKQIKANEMNGRENLINSITSSVANVYSNEELQAMSTATLEKINAQVHVNYAGAGGPQVFENATAPLTRLPVILAPVKQN